MGLRDLYILFIWLSETNILYLKRCNCVDILHCKCPQDNKCDIMLADFDSLEAYLSSCYSPKFSGVVVTPAGTRYYRSPEVYLLYINFIVLNY